MMLYLRIVVLLCVNGTTRPPKKTKKTPSVDGASDLAGLFYFTVTLTATDGIPFATTSNELAPVSIAGGTSK